MRRTQRRIQRDADNVMQAQDLVAPEDVCALQGADWNGQLKFGNNQFYGEFTLTFMLVKLLILSWLFADSNCILIL